MMRPLFLHLDDALAGQQALLADGAAAGGLEVDGRIIGPSLRLWAREADLATLGQFLAATMPAPGGDPLMTFYGSGDFHHVSALLIERATAAYAGQVTVVHIDNHPDWVRFRGGLHCGSWVGRVARLPGVVLVLTVGPCSADIVQPWRKGADLALVRSGAVELYPYGADGAAQHSVRGISRPTIAGMGEAAFLDMLVARIPTEAVYVTIDKDALRADDAVSNWDQGRLSLALLERLIARLGATRRIIGADVCGDWSRPIYGGSAFARAAKRVEAWLDQPRTPPAPATLAVNEAVNRALLGRFAAAA